MRDLTRPPRTRTAPAARASARPGPHHQHGVPTSDDSHALVVEVRQDRPRPLVTVSGELDVSSAGLVMAMLDHVRRSRRGGGGRDGVDVDLSGVTFADSHGLSCVLDSRTRVVATSPAVRRVRRLLHALPHTDLQRLPQQGAGVA